MTWWVIVNTTLRRVSSGGEIFTTREDATRELEHRVACRPDYAYEIARLDWSHAGGGAR